MVKETQNLKISLGQINDIAHMCGCGKCGKTAHSKGLTVKLPRRLIWPHYWKFWEMYSSPQLFADLLTCIWSCLQGRYDEESQRRNWQALLHCGSALPEFWDLCWCYNGSQACKVERQQCKRVHAEDHFVIHTRTGHPCHPAVSFAGNLTIQNES